MLLQRPQRSLEDCELTLLLRPVHVVHDLDDLGLQVQNLSGVHPPLFHQLQHELLALVFEFAHATLLLEFLQGDFGVFALGDFVGAGEDNINPIHVKGAKEAPFNLGDVVAWRCHCRLFDGDGLLDALLL